MSRSSESCFDPKSGAPLREFDRRADAARAGKLDPAEWQEHEPYECGKCGKWHRRLVRDDGPIPVDVTCLMCRTGDGRPKVSYPSAVAAMEGAAALEPAGGDLGVYVCPHGRGWHLTSG